MSSSASFVFAISAVVLTGCRASSPAPACAARPVSADRSAAQPAVVSFPSLDALASRGATDAPLMREVLRVERAASRSPEVRADRDLCIRAVLAASKPVRAYFADESGATRGETTSGISGTVPPRGPVCAKKGETLHLVVEGNVEGAPPGDASARAVIFAAP